MKSKPKKTTLPPPGSREYTFEWADVLVAQDAKPKRKSRARKCEPCPIPTPYIPERLVCKECGVILEPSDDYHSWHEEGCGMPAYLGSVWDEGFPDDQPPNCWCDGVTCPGCCTHCADERKEWIPETEDSQSKD